MPKPRPNTEPFSFTFVDRKCVGDMPLLVNLSMKAAERFGPKKDTALRKVMKPALDQVSELLFAKAADPALDHQGQAREIMVKVSSTLAMPRSGSERNVDMISSCRMDQATSGKV